MSQQEFINEQGRQGEQGLRDALGLVTDIFQGTFNFFGTRQGTRIGSSALASIASTAFPALAPVINFGRKVFQAQTSVRTQRTTIPPSMSRFRRSGRRRRFRKNALLFSTGRGSSRQLAGLRRKRGRMIISNVRDERAIRNNGLSGLNHPKEVKTLDHLLQLEEVHDIKTSAEELHLISALAEGPGDNQRIGRLIKALRLLWTISIEIPQKDASKPISDAVRLLIVIDHAKVVGALTEPRLDAVLSKGIDSKVDTQSWYNQDTKPRFTILVDKVYPIANEDKNIKVIQMGQVNLTGLSCNYGGPLADEDTAGVDNVWFYIGSQAVDSVTLKGQFDLGGAGLIKFSTRFEYVG